MAENWKLIKKYKLEGVKKRLDEMNRYNEKMLNEAPGDPNDPMAGQDPMNDPAQAGMGANDPMGAPAQGGMPGNDPMAGQDPMGDPSQAGAPAGGPGANDPMGDPAQGGMPGNDPMAGQDPMNAPMPEEPESDDDEGNDMGDEETDETETDEMEEGDEVIDVDDLTMSQEETEREIGSVNKNMKTLLKVVNKCIQAISDNDKKLEDLMAEYERRNPTEDEKTNIRIKQSGPFNNMPDDFWSKKGESIYDDNMIDPRHDTEYVITFDDATNFNEKAVSDSIAKFPSKIKDYLKF